LPEILPDFSVIAPVHVNTQPIFKETGTKPKLKMATKTVTDTVTVDPNYVDPEMERAALEKCLAFGILPDSLVEHSGDVKIPQFVEFQKTHPEYKARKAEFEQQQKNIEQMKMELLLLKEKEQKRKQKKADRRSRARQPSGSASSSESEPDPNRSQGNTASNPTVNPRNTAPLEVFIIRNNEGVPYEEYTNPDRNPNPNSNPNSNPNPNPTPTPRRNPPPDPPNNTQSSRTHGGGGGAPGPGGGGGVVGMRIEISHKRMLINLSVIDILAMHQALVRIHMTYIVFLDI
jgi:hypothetical protein